MIVIQFNNISKSYHLAFRSINSKEAFFKLFQAGSKESNRTKSSLMNISFEISKGENIAIIGSNGSGKSTALKIIAGICAPSEGEVIIRGKITSLLELGAGFHYDFTGRENIFVNGSLFGMSNYYLNSKMNEIIQFSELGEKIDQPIRTYSAGMLARLAFSIAIQTKPEILLIDEVLAVGDIAFQEKCLKEFEEMKQNTETIIVMVTHSLEQAKKYCSKIIWIQDSKLAKIGPPEETVEEYKRIMICS